MKFIHEVNIGYYLKNIMQITGITPTFSPCTNIPKRQIKNLCDKQEVDHVKRSEPNQVQTRKEKDISWLFEQKINYV